MVRKLKNAHPYNPQTPNSKKKAKSFMQPLRQKEKEISSQDFINLQYAVLCKLRYYPSPTFSLFQVEKYITCLLKCFFLINFFTITMINRQYSAKTESCYQSNGVNLVAGMFTLQFNSIRTHY